MYQVSDIVKQNIMLNYIEKSYEYDVSSLITGRRRWKKTGQAFETMSKIFLAMGGILSFSSGYFDEKSLSFLSGSVSVISLSFLQFSSFCYLENKKQTNELNVILKKLGLETIPELSRDNDIFQKRDSPYYYEQILAKNLPNKDNGKGAQELENGAPQDSRAIQVKPEKANQYLYTPDENLEINDLNTIKIDIVPEKD